MDIIKEKLKEINRQKNKEVCRQYYKDNREKMIERGCAKVKCDKCDKIVSLNFLNSHKKTRLCEKRQNIKNNICPSV